MMNDESTYINYSIGFTPNAMSKIKILPEILSNKIAAGEVVERPASVVKELLENALDAGSTRIMIDIEKGGRSLIRVSDNGSGMGRDDALLALERYATSKIYNDQDLFRIQTLGFRGEALPSIAAVSRFTLVSRDPSADAGTEISVEGGKIKDVTDVGPPKGPMVTIRLLFFNTPARRKFLKTVGTEMGMDITRQAALGVHLGFKQDACKVRWHAHSSRAAARRRGPGSCRRRGSDDGCGYLLTFLLSAWERVCQ